MAKKPSKKKLVKKTPKKSVSKKKPAEKTTNPLSSIAFPEILPVIETMSSDLEETNHDFSVPKPEEGLQEKVESFQGSSYKSKEPDDEFMEEFHDDKTADDEENDEEFQDEFMGKEEYDDLFDNPGEEDFEDDEGAGDDDSDFFAEE